MDGVIVDNHHYHFKAWMALSKKYNFKLDEIIYRDEYNGKTNRELFAKIFSGISTTRIDELSYEKEMLYQDVYKNEMKPIDGLIEFLNHLKDHSIKIALGTSAPTYNVEFVLDQLNLRKYFEVIVDGKDVQKGKPDPEVYLTCAKNLKVSNNQTIVFEDSISGLISGKTAGSKIVGVATSHRREELLAYTNEVINDFQNYFANNKHLFSDQ